MYRQGDMMFVRGRIPADVTLVEDGKMASPITVQGHEHVVSDLSKARVYAANGTVNGIKYIHVREAVSITCGDLRPVTLLPGYWWGIFHDEEV